MNETFEHAACEFKSHYGVGTLHVYSFGSHEEDNLLCIEVPQAGPNSRDPLVTVQSACYTAEIFRSTDCDCHEQLHTSLEAVFAEGGYLVYMICDGRGAGLLTKIRGLSLGDSEGLDTHDAYQRLGVGIDPRDYERVATALRDLGVSKLRLLTNNPRKVAGLEAADIRVERVGLQIAPTPDSWAYLATKRSKMGHLLDDLVMPDKL